MLVHTISIKVKINSLAFNFSFTRFVIILFTERDIEVQDEHVNMIIFAESCMLLLGLSHVVQSTLLVWNSRLTSLLVADPGKKQ